MANLHAQLREIADMPKGDLQRRWTKLTGRPVPRLSTGMLRLALSYEMQAKALGRLSRTNRARLDASTPTRGRAMSLAPGMRLVREWQDSVYVVTITESGDILWNGQSWKSLSEVARTITGTRWSGPAFFGLKQKEDAA